jgi:putative transcriptional regulator
MSVSQDTIDIITRRIAGDIIISSEPSKTLKKWREIFNITQTRLAEAIEVSPSVISDYEGGRRRSPGTTFVRRFVKSLITIDKEEGSKIIRELSRLVISTADAIVDFVEFPVPVKGRMICTIVRGLPLACEELLEREVYGYTIVDSIRAIRTLSGSDFFQIFGSTTERALIFTKVSLGRSPMVAIRVQTMKPRMVILHGPKEVDTLAIDLAKSEQIPLILSKMSSEEELIISLKKFYRSIIDEKRS